MLTNKRQYDAFSDSHHNPQPAYYYSLAIQAKEQKDEMKSILENASNN